MPTGRSRNPANADAAPELDCDTRRLHGRWQRPAATWGRDEFLTFIHNAEHGVKEPGLFEGRGPLAILLIVFLGGLALNLTPCVLPMIPINLAIIGAGAKAGSRGRGFLLGGAYGAAMALVYGVLGAHRHSDGRHASARINASPWFNLGDRGCCSSCSVWRCSTSSRSTSRAFRRGMHVGDSSRGTFAAGVRHGRRRGAAGRRLRRAGRHSGRAVFERPLRDRHDDRAGACRFFLGVGMAIPWPIAGAGLAALPKPGAWMVRVKQVFGVIILATAAYYGYEAYGLFANRWVDPTDVTSSVQEKLKEGWYVLAGADSPPPSASRSRYSSTCGPPGARTV